MRNNRKIENWFDKALEDQFVYVNTTLLEALEQLDKSARGILLLIDNEKKLLRAVTDGDIRRLLLERKSFEVTLEELPYKDSVTVEVDDDVYKALDLMDEYCVSQVPVISNNEVVGVVYREKIDTKILLSTPHMGEFEKEYIKLAMDSNWVAPVGQNLNAFEEEMSKYLGGGHCLAVSCGTAGIHLALRVLDIEAGDVVLCSSLTFIASANPILYMNAVPVFIDSEPDSWNMCPIALERAIKLSIKKGRAPKAVIVANLYGQSAKYDEIRKICSRYEVVIVEDAAESLGAEYKGVKSGTLGDIGVFSFNGNKIITTSAGGMIVSNNKDYISRARFLSTQAKEDRDWYEHNTIGYNYRMSNVLAGIGRGQLKVLDDRVASRRAVFENYLDLLKDRKEIIWMPEPEGFMSTRWLSVMMIDRCDVKVTDIIEFFADNAIEARYLWKPMHLQPIFKGNQYVARDDASDFCAELFGKCLCLPSSSHLTYDQQLKVTDALQEALDSSIC